jgi:hypothetical protein
LAARGIKQKRRVDSSLREDKRAGGKKRGGADYAQPRHSAIKRLKKAVG